MRAVVADVDGRRLKCHYNDPNTDGSGYRA